MQTCTHMNEIRDVTPRTPNGCEECLKMGDTWVHLRLCLECGHVGCCDDSKNKHATKHFHAVHHPIVQSFEPGEDWRWSLTVSCTGHPPSAGTSHKLFRPLMFETKAMLLPSGDHVGRPTCRVM